MFTRFFFYPILFTMGFLCTSWTNGNAELLKFIPGEKVSYTLTQNLNVEIDLFGENMQCQSSASLDLDLKLISVNPDTFSYPFEIEATITGFRVTETQEDEDAIFTLIVDSSDLENADDFDIADALQNILNARLVFRIDDEFEMEEITGQLEICEEMCDDALLMNQFGLNLSNFQLFFTQLFHLSGQELVQNQSYLVSLYKLAGWEDDELDEATLKKSESSFYTVQSIQQDSISATWTGKAEVSDKYSSNDLSVASAIQWILEKPLHQTRTTLLKLQESSEFVKAKFEIEQTWTPLESK